MQIKNHEFILKNYLIRENISQDVKKQLTYFLIEDILKTYNAIGQKSGANTFLKDLSEKYGKKEEEE